jgi:hypothetical protein
MSFGRGFSASCLAIYNTGLAGERLYEGFDWNVNVPCNQIPSGSNETESFKTANNISTINQLVTVNHDNLTYVLLGDTLASNSLDFVASTLAVNTQCQAITAACNFASGGNAHFNCSPLFNANLTPSNLIQVGGPKLPIYYWSMQFFNDSAMTIEAMIEYPTNPIYVGIASIMQMGNNGGQVGFEYPNDQSSAVRVFALLCNSTVYDVTYSWVNGTFSTFSSLTRSNRTSAGVISGALQTSPMNYSNGYYEMTTGAAVAAFTSDTEEGIAEKMALVYSRNSLGFAAGAFAGRLNEEEHVRNSLLVARVPFAPLFTLVGLNGLYFAVAFVTALVSLSSAQSKGVRDVQTRLSIWGLVSYGFDEAISRQPSNTPENVSQSSLSGVVPHDRSG